MYTEKHTPRMKIKTGLVANMSAANTHEDAHPHFSLPSYPLNRSPSSSLLPLFLKIEKRHCSHPTLLSSSSPLLRLRAVGTKDKKKMTGCINIYSWLWVHTVTIARTAAMATRETGMEKRQLFGGTTWGNGFGREVEETNTCCSGSRKTEKFRSKE